MRYLDAVYDNPELPHRAKTVYMYLHDRMNRDRQCWPAIRTIARELSLSVSTVKRAICDLRGAGYIRTEQRWRGNGGEEQFAVCATEVLGGSLLSGGHPMDQGGPCRERIRGIALCSEEISKRAKK